MRKILFSILMILVSGVLVAGSPADLDFSATDSNGDSFKLSDYKGKVVLIDFWATWCGPCRKEIPTLINVYKDYSSRGFEIISISLDRDLKYAREFISEKKMDWIHILDKNKARELAKQYNVRFIPFTMLIGKEGKVLAQGLRGEQLRDKLKEII